MGAYVYYVTARKIALTDGTTANLAQYAYKPSYDHKFNQRMARSCKVKPALASQLTGRIVFDDQPGTKVYRFQGMRLVDDAFEYGKRKVEDLYVANPKAAVQNLWNVKYVDRSAIAFTTPKTHPVVDVVIPADTFIDAATLVVKQDNRRVICFPNLPIDNLVKEEPTYTPDPAPTPRADNDEIEIVAFSWE